MILRKLLAANDSGYQEGLMWVRGGTIIAGVGLVGTGLALMFYNPKKGPPSTPSMKLTLRLVRRNNPFCSTTPGSTTTCSGRLVIGCVVPRPTVLGGTGLVWVVGSGRGLVDVVGAGRV